MRILAILTVCLSSAVASAQQMDEGLHRDAVTKMSLLTHEGLLKTNYFFSTFNMDSNPISFSSAGGLPIAYNPTVVSSAYDRSIKSDVSGFYNYSGYRYKFILNTLPFQPGQIISVGFDSGVNASKLNIRPSFLLGYVDTYKVSERSLFNLSVGSWLGGHISESPCLDSYDRAYWCQNLTAWSDYHPNYPKQTSYIDMKLISRF